MLDNVCLPINLDAFVLNEPVCESGLSRIAPITQPDYVTLRLDNSVIQASFIQQLEVGFSPTDAQKHDVLPHVDLHSTQPAVANSRISTVFSAPLKTLDLKNPNPPAQDTVTLQNSRLGVYLHWSLPRGYRTASSAASGAQNLKSTDNSSANPVFPLVPNRWLVARVMKSYSPSNVPIPVIDAWVIESDRLRKIEDLGKDVDLETDVTPYVAFDGNSSNTNVLHSQAEKYIGYKAPLKGWTEDPTAERVPLTIFNSSNPLFADYTIHNPNVFSMTDNFQYDTGKFLDQATCDYIVVGWHSDAGDCPLGARGIDGDLEDRLQKFLCTISDSASLDTKNNTDKTALLSHGVIYGVNYDSKIKPATPADDYANNFTAAVDMEPVAIGTTPLDAVLTFLEAHKLDVSEEEHLFGAGSSSVANDILSISELLYAASDDYDSRVKASDLILSQNYVSTDGGFTWNYDKRKDSNGPPAAPSTQKNAVTGKSEVDYLNLLVELQNQLDITNRTLAIQRWSLFAQFFNFCSDAHNNVPSNLPPYVSKVQALFNTDVTKPGSIQTLLQTQASLQQQIQQIIGPSPPLVAARKVPKDPFFMRSDPSIVVAGIDSGWPAQFLDRILVRLDSEINATTNAAVTTLLSSFTLPSAAGNIMPTIAKLLNEGSDGTRRTTVGFKTWNGQPFCPVFIEWEAIYYNIDFPNWDLQLSSSPISTINQKQVRYINPSPLSGMDAPKQDTRACSGRILVLPQPTFALAAIVKQVFSTAGQNLPDDLKSVDAQNALLTSIGNLKFISGDLTGFTDSLLTLGTGSHVKPNVREQGQDVQPLQEAIDVTSKIGMVKDHFVQIGSESAKTPFGSLTDFTSSKFQPFKGVQQGQLAITKLTIVDKFGQAVSCPLPKATPRVKPVIPEFIHPCLSNELCPSILPDNTLNTVFSSTDAPTSSGSVLSPFIQITPSINQSTRINTAFVEKAQDPKLWKTCSDWEYPIFGWIIVNYADSALQFFTGDGIFYTSLRFGGPSGIMTAPKWAPFAEPSPGQVASLISDQLTNLIKEMQGGTPSAQAYLLAFWDMINQAIETMPFPPSQYSGFANAIVGKPLALVNAGCSLEMAQSALKAQHTLGLLPGQLGPTEEDAMSSYKFKVKLGDSERPFDGLVCYWDSDNGTTGDTSFDTIYTYFPDKSGKPDPRKMIEPDSFPTLTPYFIDPLTFTQESSVIATQAAKFMVKTMLIDPYTPFHLYTGILPIKSLQLPAWSLDAAMRNMTAFFTLGPILTTIDVPKVYNSKEVLTADSWLTTQDNPTTNPDAYQIKLPIAGGKGMWNWLQPYVDPSPPTTNTDSPRPLYNSLQVGPEDGRLRNDPAPYTMLEGFLQLARPLIKDPSI